MILLLQTIIKEGIRIDRKTSTKFQAMSDKLFESKALQHVYSYEFVHKLVTYVLSYSILNYIYQQLVVVYAKINQLIITPYLSPYLSLVDGKLNSLLTNVDNLGLKSFNLLKFTNDESFKKLNQLFPDDKYALKNSSELEKSIEIFKQFLTRFYKFTITQSNEVSKQIVDTYSQQVKENDGNIVVKNFNAGVNTANITFETYIKPLQTKTTDLINDGKTYLNDVTTQTKTKINDVTTQTKTKITDVTTQTKTKAQEVLNDGKKKAQEFVSVEEVPVVKASA